ncbi:MAG TPA: TIGR01777 family oxidoreductase [Solirubrobacterales bacterium]|nr:TIGR01777 family oxidoreductase [Solirubrobacterales bacterium]
MRVLVTGASGLLGSAICDGLLARGDEVVGLTRNPETARPKNPRVTWHAWRATAEPPPPAALEGLDGVVNLIGEEINQRLTDQAKVRIRESRIIGTRNLLEGVEASPTEPSVFVGQSAIGYYGDRGDEVVDEESQPGEGFTAEVPIDWEAAEREAEGTFDRVVIFRTGLVLSKDGGLLKQLLLPFKLGVGGPIAGGDQYMSWIHIEDVVGLFLWALDDQRVWGVINATAPNPATNREFSKALGRALQRPALMPVPRFAVAALRGGELADAVAGGARVMPRRALDLGYEFRHPELDEALRSALR